MVSLLEQYETEAQQPNDVSAYDSELNPVRNLKN